MWTYSEQIFRALAIQGAVSSNEPTRDRPRRQPVSKDRKDLRRSLKPPQTVDGEDLEQLPSISFSIQKISRRFFQLLSCWHSTRTSA